MNDEIKKLNNELDNMAKELDFEENLTILDSVYGVVYLEDFIEESHNEFENEDVEEEYEELQFN